MSFEGFDIKVCENGHLSHIDVYDYEFKGCPICGGSFVFIHTIDQTNGLDEKDLKIQEERAKRYYKKWKIRNEMD